MEEQYAAFSRPYNRAGAGKGLAAGGGEGGGEWGVWDRGGGVMWTASRDARPADGEGRRQFQLVQAITDLAVSMTKCKKRGMMLPDIESVGGKQLSGTPEAKRLA